MVDGRTGDTTAGGGTGLEVAARLGDRPGNPAVTPDGRLILSLHPFPYGEPSPYASFSSDVLGERVESYGEKAPCDGIGIDAAGNVHVTDLPNNAIGVTGPNGSYQVLVKDDEHLIWPDGMSYGSDGFYYVAVSQLHRAAPLNAGEEASETPFEILRFRPLAPSAIGR